MGTPLFVIGADGSILYANASACELIGLGQHELTGAKVDGVLAPLATLIAGADKYPDGHGEVQRGKRSLGYRLTRTHNGEPERYAVTVQDITDLKVLRAERDKLLRLATIGDALPTILHELRNPIASITNSVEVALEESIDDETRQLLHAVLSEARRISVSLEGLGVAARQLRAFRPMPVDYAVREACRLVSGRAREAGIDFESRIPDLPLLPIDPAAMRAIVFNLVINAIHACSAGDGIVVSLELQREPPVAILRVRDTGKGMNAETLARARELFFTTKRSGSGIGLALCDRLATEYGGAFRIESTAGEGTTVSLELPVP